MKLFLFALLLIVLTISPLASARASGNCPAWLTNIPGRCLDSISTEAVEGLPDWFQYTENWHPGRNLISYRFSPAEPSFPFLLGSNFNKWSLYPEWVYSDERMMNGLYFKTLYIGARLVCNESGSKNPKIIFSVPNSEIVWRYPQNIYFTITNYEIVNQPCNY